MPAHVTLRNLGGGCLIAVAAAALLTAGCGDAAAVQQPAAAATPRVVTDDPPVPQMIMVTFTDRGYRASDIGIRLSRPAMLMLANEGVGEHSMRVALPVAGLQVVGADSGAAPSIQATTGVVDVRVAGGQESDVTFTPTQQGTYALLVDGAPAGNLVVTP